MGSKWLKTCLEYESVNQSFISDFSEYSHWSQRTKNKIKTALWLMYRGTFYGRHTAQHQLQWRQIKIKIASHMILSGRRLGETRHPCRIPTVVLNQSLVLPLNRTALWALSYRFSMTNMMLAMMLYFLIVAHKASCHTLSKAFLKSMKTW